METAKSLHHLNSLLRGEIAAVETYRQAIPSVSVAVAKSELVACEKSHQQRVDQLKNRIATLGGKPAAGSGAWGSFAKLIEGGAKLIGVRAAIAALEEWEDRGMADYQRDLSDLDFDSRKLVEDELRPAQERTHRAMSALKAAMD